MLLVEDAHGLRLMRRKEFSKRVPERLPGPQGTAEYGFLNWNEHYRGVRNPPRHLDRPLSALTQQARAGLHAQRGSPRAGSVFPVGLRSSSRVGSSECQPAMLQIDFRFFGASSRFFRTVAGEAPNRFSLLRVTSFDWVSSSKRQPAKLQIDFRFFGSADRFFQSVAGKAPNEFLC